jgi:hypothetical protein
MAKLQMQSTQSESDGGMFPSQTQKKRTFDPIPEGTIVDVEVVSVELRDLNPEFRAKYKIKETQEVSFRFKVISGPFANRNLWGNAKPIFNDADNCRLRLWAQEILGVDRLPADYKFDTDHFAGLKARVLVKNYQKRDGTTGDGVQDVLRALEDRFANEEPF